MIRKILFWLHLSVGVTAGVFIFIMAATGVMLSFERQLIEFVDRNRGASTTISAVVDAGTRGQPQYRTQYLLNRDTGAIVKESIFANSTLAQRLRAFVRFGHTGEYGGWLGQFIAAIASLGACVLVYSGLSLGCRRLAATIKRNGRDVSTRQNRSEELTLAGTSGGIRRS